MPFVRREDCDLHYEVQGEGPPLVLAAGLGGTAGWWAPQAARYAQEFTLLTFDQRGTGRSSRVPVASIGQMAEDLSANNIRKFNHLRLTHRLVPTLVPTCVSPCPR